MRSELKPYPAYRDSGVEWLGKVPEHWSTASVKRHYAIQLGKMLQNKPESSVDEEVAYLKAQHVQWNAVRASPAQKMWCHPHEIMQYGIAAGDLLVCEGGEGGRSGIVRRVPSQLIIQNALHRVRSLGVCLNEYLQYVMNTVAATGWFDANNCKATIAHFTREKFGALGTPIPSQSEQSAIVRYLDYMDRRIQRYIRAKQKLIKLLEEQKQAIIHQAVTGRIDVRTGKPYPAYKPSGVEWLGDVPEHWEVMPLSRVSVSRCDGPFGSGLKSVHYTDDGIRVVRLQNIGFASFNDTDTAYISCEHYKTLGDHDIEAEDIIIAGLGDENHPAGRACVAPESILPAMVKADCFRFRLRRESLDPAFAAMLLSSTATDSAALLSTGATRQRINLQSMGSRRIVVPPLGEQMEIVRFAGESTALLVNLIARFHSQIHLLREYRTRLISDVVTGKLDVREAAANLPDELEEEPEEDQKQEDEAGEDFENEQQSESEDGVEG